MKEPITILLSDEQPLFREGIRATLEGMEGCTIMGISTYVGEILDLVRTGNPDVVLLDMGLRTADALDVARQIRRLAPRTALILLTPGEDEEQLFQAIKVGAAAYATRSITPQELRETVSRVQQGEYLINGDVLVKPHLASRILHSFRELAVEKEGVAMSKKRSFPLSGRELEILSALADGKRNKDIARTFHISERTVKNHLTSILKKLSVRDRTAAVMHALRHGWIAFHPSETLQP